MRIAIAATSALALAVAMPVLAQGNGNGNGNGNAGAKVKPGNGNGNGNAGNPRGGPPAARGNGNARNAVDPIERRVERRIEREADRVERDVERRVERRVDRAQERIRDVAGEDARDVFARIDRQAAPVRGFCPPGLAKKNNGCQPPGQAKKLQSQRFGGYYGSAYSRLSGDDWRYYDGYAYRPSQGGVIESLVPLVGGALFRGNEWPSAYDSYRAPAYYGNYFGQDPARQYYYADRTLFSVDPEDRAIMGIAALLTGDDIAVGQRLPTGYSAYNVPYAYRDRYRDGPDAMYRYSDGYVYEVDPETRIVAAAIELLT